MTHRAYKRLAERLDSLPNGFPPTQDGAELRLLEKIFTPEQADLAAQLSMQMETADAIAARIQADPGKIRKALKGMARNGLIRAEKTESGLGFSLMPFVVGIYEMQISRIDAEMAALFEDYYKQAFSQALNIQPQFHRVIPVQESIPVDLQIRPYENVSTILDNAQAWGVMDCICRKQKQLIGDPCDHPLDVCMIFSQTAGAFNNNSTIRALTHEEAVETLRRAAQAGLVHSVSNNQKGTWYICNCCTCSCGILRGLSEMGISNVIARSSFVNHVDEDLCVGCELCLDSCQFGALSHNGVAQVDPMRCVGCGVCIAACPEGALSMQPREAAEVSEPPVSMQDWLAERAQARGMDLDHLR